MDETIAQLQPDQPYNADQPVSNQTPQLPVTPAHFHEGLGTPQLDPQIALTPNYIQIIGSTTGTPSDTPKDGSIGFGWNSSTNKFRICLYKNGAWHLGPDFIS